MGFIEFKNIYKQYEKAPRPSVTDFNLDVDKNEFIAFVGPSGCGKSTTLRMLAGFESITSGDLLINGKRMNDVAAFDRGVSMVFQNYALYPHMTVEKNIAFGLKNMKVPPDEIKQKVDWAVDILGLSEYRDRKPRNLSGGQCQRVAVGRAIVKNRDILLMDEPLSNLDAKLRVSMRNEISKLHRELGSTTIYVTHDQVEAMTMADGRNIVFSNGEKIELPEQTANALAPYKNKGVTMGIRGEDIKFDQQNMEIYPNAKLHSKIDNTEIMGNENNLYFDVSGTTSVARVSKYEVSRDGDEVDFVMMPHKMHFFDKETEELIPV